LKLFGVLDYKISFTDPCTIFEKEILFFDSLILSRLSNPNRTSHSLKHWGEVVDLDKIDYRQWLVKQGFMCEEDPKGAEFSFYNEKMIEYCNTDTIVTVKAFIKLMAEINTKGGYEEWKNAINCENTLANYSIRRELFGFDFDVDLAIKTAKTLSQEIEAIFDRCNSTLPPKKLTKTKLNNFTPPKTQIKKDGDLSSYMSKFIAKMTEKGTKEEPNKKTGLQLVNGNYIFQYKDNFHTIPFDYPLEVLEPSSIDDISFIKEYLVSLGWEPIEWNIRDFTKDSTKKKINYKKRIKALAKYYYETLTSEYKFLRYDYLEINSDKEFKMWYYKCKLALKKEFPVLARTTPKVKIGVQKKVCPNLKNLAKEQQLDFVEDFITYTVFNHRRNSIASKEFDISLFPNEIPNSGFLASLREDGRISTPSIEIGATSNRYTHSVVANIPRATSILGAEFRSFFGAGKGYFQYGTDFSSLENRVQGHFVKPFTNGKELAEQLLAEKPDDLHTKRAEKLNITRDESKSINYGILYGASAKKVAKMLNKPLEEGSAIYENFWDSTPALKELKEYLVKMWYKNNKNYIVGIDNRKIITRSEHSLLNYLFQSGGVIIAKYVLIFLLEELEKKGYKINPFTHIPDICPMIEYHDEYQLAVNEKLKENGIFTFKYFANEDEAHEFAEEYYKVHTEEHLKLSSIKKDNDKKELPYYIVLPNPISIGMTKAVKKVEEMLELNMKFTFEYDIHTTWYGCH
jgi:hypothetical protein